MAGSRPSGSRVFGDLAKLLTKNRRRPEKWDTGGVVEVDDLVVLVEAGLESKLGGEVGEGELVGIKSVDQEEGDFAGLVWFGEGDAGVFEDRIGAEKSGEGEGAGEVEVLAGIAEWGVEVGGEGPGEWAGGWAGGDAADLVGIV